MIDFDYSIYEKEIDNDKKRYVIIRSDNAFIGSFIIENSFLPVTDVRLCLKITNDKNETKYVDLDQIT